jgi:hypothetical protein
MNLNFAQICIKKLNKFLEIRFIIFMKKLKWVSPIIVTIKKIEKLRAFVDYSNKNYHPLPFINENLNEVVDHELYSFKDGYSEYNQFKIAN